MVRKLKGQKGHYYAQVDEIRLHSPYDPFRESERFIRTKITTTPSKILLLGPGLGYLIDTCKKFFPDAGIISIFYHPDFFLWYNESGTISYLFENAADFSVFLRKNLHELDLEGLEVIEWPGSSRVFPKISQMVNSIIHNTILELHSNFLTTDAFGKKMVLNRIKNFLFHSNIIDIEKIQNPVVIAASGPSLEKAAPKLLPFRDKYTLLALPSSLELLQNYNIEPDAVVMTDPGFYSRFHAFSLYRNFSSKIPCILSLSSGFSPAVVNNPAQFIGWDPVFELQFLSFYYDNNHIIPETGTVAGTAYELCMRLTPPAVLYTGLDFSYYDILSHARPHIFYSMFMCNAWKAIPFESTLFSRKINFDDNSNSFSAYSTWFSKKLKHAPDIFYRIFPSIVSIPGFTPIDEKGLQEFFQGYPDKYENLKYSQLPVKKIETRTAYVLRQIEVISEAIQQIQNSDNLPTYRELTRNERLFQLLFMLNPIKLKSYKHLSRNSDSSSQQTLSFLLEESKDFFSGIRRWLLSV